MINQSKWSELVTITKVNGHRASTPPDELRRMLSITDLSIRSEDEHRAELDGMTRGEQAAYVCTLMPHDQPKQLIQWLNDHGANIPKTGESHMRRQISLWRRADGRNTSGDLVALTPERLAEIDATADRDDRDQATTIDRDQSPVVATPDAELPADPITPPATPEMSAVASADSNNASADDDVPVPAVDEKSDTPRGFLAGLLLTVVGILLAGVIIAPIALSSQDIIHWARDPHGLGLTGAWPVITFIALDAAAAFCVGLVVYCAWRGDAPGVFAWLVWAFAGMSAIANYNFSTRPGAPDDAWWFFPLMSIAGPFLLEVTTRRVRKWMQEDTGKRAKHGVSFGAARWIPGVGSFRDTYGAWRLAKLDGIDDADQAVTAFRQLCPDGKLNIVKRLRARDAASSPAGSDV